MKRCAVINDISGFGKCSLTAAIPVLSVMGIEVNPVVTAVLSNQTGYDSYHMAKLDDYIVNLIDEWKKLDVSFDAIMTGFIGDISQFDYIERFINQFKREDTLLVVDPVMADNGAVYDNYSNDMCKRVCELCKKADVITPNATELSIICQSEFTTDSSKIIDYARSIITQQLKTVIVTGVVQSDCISNICVTADSADIFTTDYVNKSFSGTGDLFCSAVTGGILNGKSPQDAVKTAQKFISSAINSTPNINTNDGVYFEKHLSDLL